MLATQTLRQKRARNMQVRIEGALAPGVAAKDLVLAVIGAIGAAGATGYAMEFVGGTVRQLSMEARMTMCNMAIEAGSRTGLIAPDETTFSFLHGRPLAPVGEDWKRAKSYWQTLATDANAHFDRTFELDASAVTPQVTWGTSPEQVLPITSHVPDPGGLAAPMHRSC